MNKIIKIVREIFHHQAVTMANILRVPCSIIRAACFILSLSSVIGCSYQTSNFQNNTSLLTVRSSNFATASSAQLAGSVSLVRGMPSVHNSSIISNSDTAALYVASTTNRRIDSDTPSSNKSKFKGNTFGFLPLPKDYEKAVILAIPRPYAIIDYASKGAIVALYTSENTRPKVWDFTNVDLPFLNSADFLKGNFRIIHREAWPTWYAPDGYFKAKRLPIPPPFAAERFLENMLGPLALFVAEDIVIHCGSMQAGHVWLPCNVVEELYSALPNKAVVIIGGNNHLR